jgi:fatty-acyl-CoA synthase
VAALEGVRSDLPPGVECWVQGADCHDFRDLGAEVARMSSEPLASSEVRAPSIADPALYIYTSGTTGLPKAANVSHSRLMHWSHWFAGLMDTRPSDRMYNCLPLYHSVGGVVATGATLVGGGTVVLREKFSASDFWRDVVAERCTLFQYIGELCRYLVNSPPHPQEADHFLRLCCGNGLQLDVWEEFKNRFRIPQILEFYAATEGNFSLYNCEEQPGAIGRIPAFLGHRLPVALVKFDVETAAPLRNAEGFCERTATNEAGEAIGRILDTREPSRFEGYADPEASAEKVLRNVFESGDAWYRTGDLMRRDASGFFYFVDRVGDSYRWKGENVSSVEVGAALVGCSGVSEAVVYGVKVPGSDGRAGMAALVVSAAFDLEALRAEVASRLPDYARPFFLRILPALELTGTFKPKKRDLVLEGFDPAAVTDPLYFDDRTQSAYVRLDGALFELLQSGGLRL